jgi:uncharacterized protein (TIGR02391 family)
MEIKIETQSLISKYTRSELREIFVRFFTLREIEDIFEGSNIVRNVKYQSSRSGERRALVDQYYENIDFNLDRAITNFLNVCEEVVERLYTEEDVFNALNAKRAADGLIRRLNKDGYNYNNGRFVTGILISSDSSVVLVNQAQNENILPQDNNALFLQRNFHSEINIHSKQLFLDEYYFHAVFEAAKVYNKRVKQKSKEKLDGQPLMHKVWGSDTGVLKITECISETDHNVQNGIKFLSAGLMSAFRNPTSHEPALDWPISKEDCLDILNFISFLFRKLDQALYVKYGGK